MRFLPFLALLPAIGCQSGPATYGWRFECGRPASIAGHAVVTQLGGATAVQPMGAIATGGAVTTNAAALAMSAGDCGPTGGAARFGMQLTCTLEEVCRRLEMVERRLRNDGAERIPAPARPLPE